MYNFTKTLGLIIFLAGFSVKGYASDIEWKDLKTQFQCLTAPYKYADNLLNLHKEIEEEIEASGPLTAVMCAMVRLQDDPATPEWLGPLSQILGAQAAFYFANAEDRKEDFRGLSQQAFYAPLQDKLMGKISKKDTEDAALKLYSQDHQDAANIFTLVNNYEHAIPQLAAEINDFKRYVIGFSPKREGGNLLERQEAAYKKGSALEKILSELLTFVRPSIAALELGRIATLSPDNPAYKEEQHLWTLLKDHPFARRKESDAEENLAAIQKREEDLAFFEKTGLLFIPLEEYSRLTSLRKMLFEFDEDKERA